MPHDRAPSGAYGPRFWATYLANIGLMVAVSLLFRYADFVAAMGGSEEQLGVITGIGMLGAISARCFQGRQSTTMARVACGIGR